MKFYSYVKYLLKQFLFLWIRDSRR